MSQAPPLPLVPRPSPLHTHPVPKKRKPRKFTAVTAVKSMSRTQIGAVPPTRRVDDTKKKRSVTKPKHKPTLAQELDEL